MDTKDDKNTTQNVIRFVVCLRFPLLFLDSAHVVAFKEGSFLDVTSCHANILRNISGLTRQGPSFIRYFNCTVNPTLNEVLSQFQGKQKTRIVV